MAEKTEKNQVTQNVTEQAPRNEVLEAKIERVQFSPVDKLEELSKVGFCTERLTSPELGAPLFRLCCEVTKGDIEQLPVAITPFVSAESLSDLVSGAVLLQPMVIKVIKEHQKNEDFDVSPEPKVEDE